MFLKSNIFKGLLFRLTSLNVLMITLSIVISSFAIYQTACLLVDTMGDLGPGRQSQFESLLLQYLIVFSLLTILIGSLLHFYLTKNLIRPIRQLIQSTKQLKSGTTPEKVDYASNNEVGELVDQYNDLLQQIETNNKLRKKMITDISHEIRTPVQNLNGYLYALKNGDIELNQDMSESLYNESQRLIRLIIQFDQIKEWDLVKEETIIQQEQVEISEIINQCISAFEWKFTNADIKLDVEVEPCTIDLQVERVQQVIHNLLDNAYKYHVNNGPVIIRGSTLEESYKFAISSNGQPIPVSEYNHIFKRFYRLDVIGSRHSNGSGLGLSIAQEIIHKHRGEMGVTSTDQSNTFWFTLPK